MTMTGSEIKHYMNPLHVYCRLRDVGLGKDRARCVCQWYERCVFKHFILKKEEREK
jgi:hypothetical protein